MTVTSTSGNIDAYIEDKFDSMNMGYGENRDGVLLLVCMESREYRILSNGYAGEAIGMDQIDAISEAIVSNLSDGDYADAFITFADNCAYYLDGYLNGYPFNAGKCLHKKRQYADHSKQRSVPVSGSVQDEESFH
jgi:uncharacterized membrane protein YgcG